jgi:hypothetical protein
MDEKWRKSKNKNKQQESKQTIKTSKENPNAKSCGGNKSLITSIFYSDY